MIHIFHVVHVPALIVSVTDTGDMSSGDEILARYLQENRPAAEALLVNHLPVLSPQQIAFLHRETSGLNPSAHLLHSRSGLMSQQIPFGPAIHQYQEHPFISAALQQIHQPETSFVRNRNSTETEAGTSLMTIGSTHRQLEQIRSTTTNQGAGMNQIGVDQTVAMARLQNYVATGSTNYYQHFVANPIAIPERQNSAVHHGHFPFSLSHADDKFNLSSHQQFLRLHIQVFQADEEDILTYVRGRNRPILLQQIGIRCCHCAHMKVSLREKGSTYYPANIMGIYQAAQNMSSTHIQCGRCPPMPSAVKEHFKGLIATKSASNGAGRTYWADKIREMGVIDAEHGIFSTW